MNPGEGPISAVALYVPVGAAAPTHLFSGGVDGTLAVWSAGRSWDCLKVMTGHRKEITSLSIHPSGKLALSTSRDSTLRIWDLIKGRCSYHHILEAIADVVAFSPSGNLYALVSGTKVTVHKIGQEAGLVGELTHPRRVLCLAWHKDNVLLTGTEAGTIHAWDTSTSKQICEMLQAHQTRLRGLVVDAHTTAAPFLPAEAELQSPALQRPCIVASAASDGTIKMWTLDITRQDLALQAVSELSTGARLTCLSLVRPQSCSENVGKQHSQDKYRKKLAVKASETSAKKAKRKPAADKDKSHLVSVQKPDLKKVGVVRNGVVDFTLDAQPPQIQASSVPAEKGKQGVQKVNIHVKKRRAK